MYFQVQCMLLTHDYPIEIYISAFHLRHLCIPTRLVKSTHNIKTSLIKQCYTWYAWLGLLGLRSPTMLITDVLLCILLLYCCTTVDVCSILHAQCSVFDQYIFPTVSCSNHAVFKSRPLKTKQIQHLIQHFEIIQNLVSLSNLRSFNMTCSQTICII
jgi:hypothetical protein